MSFAACARLVQQGDPERFLAVMAAPVAAREALFALYAFNVEVSRAPWVTAEPLIAEMRLQWWSDVLEEIAAGGEVRRHEVVDALAATLTPRLAQHLARVVEARRWDIYGEAMPEPSALLAHLEAGAGTLMEVADALTGTPPRPEAARALGQAQGLAGWCVALGRLQAAGRSPWPYGTQQGRALIAQCLDALDAHRPLRPRTNPAFLAGWMAQTTLRRAHRHAHSLFSAPLTTSPARQRVSLAKAALLGRL